MAEYFPADLCREILLHLPVKSLIRFRAVCKSWESLITSPSFIYAHISNAKTNSILRHHNKDNSGSRYSLVEFTENNEVNSPYKFEFPYKSGNGRFRVVSSCDGLVCLTNNFFWDDSYSVILWNPSVRNHVVLPKASTIPKKACIASLAFGVADHVYKIVRIFCRRRPDNSFDSALPRAEIYSLGTGRWRMLPAFGIDFYLMHHQTSLKGVLHWICSEWYDDRPRSWLLGFEVADEVFHEIMLPDVLAREDVMRLRLHAIDGTVAVAKLSLYNEAPVVDVWAMKKYGLKESWTKLYKIDVAEDFKRLIGFRNGEALLAYGDWELVAYNLETRKTNNLGISGYNKIVDDYVESLLLLKGNRIPDEQLSEEVREKFYVSELAGYV